MVIDKTIFQTNAPSHSDVIWAKPEEDKITLHMYNRGKWMPVSGGGSGSSDSSEYSKFDGRTKVALPETIIYDRTEGELNLEDINIESVLAEGDGSISTNYLQDILSVISTYKNEQNLTEDELKNLVFTYTQKNGDEVEIRWFSLTKGTFCDGKNIYLYDYGDLTYVPIKYRYVLESQYRYSDERWGGTIYDFVTQEEVSNSDIPNLTDVIFCFKYCYSGTSASPIFDSNLIFHLMQIEDVNSSIWSCITGTKKYCINVFDYPWYNEYDVTPINQEK